MSPPSSSQTSLSSPITIADYPSTASSPRSWLQTPKPIRILFTYFPLRTLPANNLPAHTLPAPARGNHTLFIWTSADSHDVGGHLIPSFNPTCLKWQTYMLMHGVEFRVAASNNHASPSGALPFIIPAEGSQEQRRKKWFEKSDIKDGSTVTPTSGTRDTTGSETPPSPVTASGLQPWIHEQSQRPLGPRNPSEKMRCEAYVSLIEHRIRPAWLHALYLTPNLHSLVAPLYIQSSTNSIPIRLALTRDLRQAARNEILKSYPTLASNPTAAVKTIYSSAETALEALDTLLQEEGNQEGWFFGAMEPGLLDASVFAYTFLLLDDAAWGGRWTDEGPGGNLRTMVRKHKRLESHMKKVRGCAFGEREAS